jgi:hypothetical protein
MRESTCRWLAIAAAMAVSFGMAACSDEPRASAEGAGEPASAEGAGAGESGAAREGAGEHARSEGGSEHARAEGGGEHGEGGEGPARGISDQMSTEVSAKKTTT